MLPVNATTVEQLIADHYLPMFAEIGAHVVFVQTPAFDLDGDDFVALIACADRPTVAAAIRIPKSVIEPKSKRTSWLSPFRVVEQQFRLAYKSIHQQLRHERADSHA